MLTAYLEKLGQFILPTRELFILKREVYLQSKLRRQNRGIKYFAHVGYSNKKNCFVIFEKV